jgi:tRNA(fMet)-specific endonuclease VapC
MPVYMLDTDISSYIMKRSHDVVLSRLQQVPIGDVCISVVTKCELLYGVEFSPQRSQDQTALDGYLRHIKVLEYPDEAALHHAQIRGTLKMSGTMIGANDLFIAAHARSLGLTLVTNNTREFGRVQDLQIENWTSSAAQPVQERKP